MSFIRIRYACWLTAHGSQINKRLYPGANISATCYTTFLTLLDYSSSCFSVLCRLIFCFLQSTIQLVSMKQVTC